MNIHHAVLWPCGQTGAEKIVEIKCLGKRVTERVLVTMWWGEEDRKGDYGKFMFF